MKFLISTIISVVTGDRDTTAVALGVVMDVAMVVTTGVVIGVILTCVFTAVVESVNAGIVAVRGKAVVRLSKLLLSIAYGPYVSIYC